MSFIRLTDESGTTMFVLPEAISAYGAERKHELSKTHFPGSWLLVFGKEVHVRETCEEIMQLMRIFRPHP